MSPEGDSDLRPRVTSLEHASSEHRQQISALETWRNKAEIEHARKDEQMTAMKLKLDGIDSTLTWLNRIVIGAIVLALTLFALKGGFNLPNI